jgi:DNA-binding beta-propeller fold protein YncE
MNRNSAFIALLAFPLFLLSSLQAQSPLTLAETFQMPPDAKGHFDHSAIDLEGHRLFTTPEDYKAVIVFDYTTGKIVKTIPGIGTPHAVLYRGDLGRIYVTDGDPGSVKIFDDKAYRLSKVIPLLAHTDSISYDPSTKYLYVITGGRQAQQEVSEIAVIDTTSERLEGRIQIPGDALEAMAMESGGPRLYVNNTSKNRIDVIDRNKRVLLTSWPITLARKNTSIALDEARHRLFVGCRSGSLVVFDTATGKELTSLPMTKDVDDMIFDPATGRVYASCGEGDGVIEIYQENDPDHIVLLAQVASGPVGKTSLLSTTLHRYFVSVPQHGSTNASVLVYDVH